MNAFLTYIIEVNLYIVIFGLSYHFLFRNQPYHQANRWVILGSIFISFTIPFIDFTTPDSAIQQVVQLNPVLVNAKANISHTPLGYNFPSFISILYWIGFGVSGFYIFRRLWSLRSLYAAVNPFRTKSNQIITHTAVKTPSSFFKTIFLTADLDSESRESIIAHELVHIREKHTVDILFMQLAQAFCWFNPMIYKFMNALEAAHEFRADQVATQTRIDKTAYSNVLISRAMDIHPRVLSHQFSKSNLLKRRIMMLNKSSKPSTSRWKYFLIIPIVFGAVFINACSEKNADTNPTMKSETPAAEHSDQKSNSEKMDGTDIYITADQMPEYPGGQQAMMKFLGENIKYPESCKKEGIEGTVFISFVIDKSGNPTDLNVLRSPDERLSANAMEVVGKMPAWTPGENDGKPVKVQYNLPIRYQLK